MTTDRSEMPYFSWRFAFCVVLFLLIYWAWFQMFGKTAMVLIIAPLYYFARRHGRWGGFVAAVAALPLNLALFYLLGGSELLSRLDAPFWVSSVVLMPIFYETGLSFELRRRLASELERSRSLVVALRNERDRVWAASEAKDALLMGISHDLRTPASVIVQTARLLDDQPEPVARRARMIHDAGQQLLRVLNDLLRGYRQPTHPPPEQPRPLDLHGLLREVVALHLPLFAAKGLALRLDWRADLPRWVEGLETPLQRILINLLSNSLKHTADGGVVLRAVRVTEGADADALELTVNDSGPGIPAHLIGPILARTRERPGPVSADDEVSFGLGLGNSLRLCEEIGARLSLRPNAPRGLTATVRLPMREVAAPREVGSSSHNEAPAPVTGLHTLVVDDEPASAESLAEMLRARGCSVRIASSGIQAIEAASTALFDLAFLDLQLPDICGEHLAERLRGQVGHTRLVLFSANILLTDLEQWLNPALDLILSKPATSAEIARVCALSGRQGAGVCGAAVGTVSMDSVASSTTPRHRSLMEGYVAQCLIAFGRQDLQECARQAHKMASATATLRLTALSERASQAEDAARSGCRIATFCALRELGRVYRAVLGADLDLHGPAARTSTPESPSL